MRRGPRWAPQEKQLRTTPGAGQVAPPPRLSREPTAWPAPPIPQNPVLTRSSRHQAEPQGAGGSPQGLGHLLEARPRLQAVEGPPGPTEGGGCACPGCRPLDPWEAEGQGQQLRLLVWGSWGPNPVSDQSPRLQDPNRLLHCTSLGPVVPPGSAQPQ